MENQDTNMRSTEARRRLEMSNYHSDVMVFKGLKTGQTRVTVKLQEKGYEVRLKAFQLRLKSIEC